MREDMKVGRIEQLTTTTRFLPIQGNVHRIFEDELEKKMREDIFRPLNGIIANYGADSQCTRWAKEAKEAFKAYRLAFVGDDTRGIEGIMQHGTPAREVKQK